jgi:hypothetical protein
MWSREKWKNIDDRDVNSYCHAGRSKTRAWKLAANIALIHVWCARSVEIARDSRGIQEERKIMATKRFSNNSESAAYFRAKISLDIYFPWIILKKCFFSTIFHRLNYINSFLSLKKRGDYQLVSMLVASKFPILPMVPEIQMNAV